MATKPTSRAQRRKPDVTIAELERANAALLKRLEEQAAEHDAEPPVSRRAVAVIAHALHDPLTAIASYLEASRLLLERGHPEQVEKARSAISQAQAQILRARDLLKRLHGLTD